MAKVGLEREESLSSFLTQAYIWLYNAKEQWDSATPKQKEAHLISYELLVEMASEIEAYKNLPTKTDKES